MSKCIPCSKVTTTEKSVIKFFKKLYKDSGTEYYVYRLGRKETFNFVKKELFTKILEEQIKPNFKNGAEYFHISEFTGA